MKNKTCQNLFITNYKLIINFLTQKQTSVTFKKVMWYSRPTNLFVYANARLALEIDKHCHELTSFCFRVLGPKANES